MELSFQKYCPSCGAPLDLKEGERVIDCDYCRVKNYMVINAALRFVLPDKIPAEIAHDNIFYVPYVRFKGAVYSHRGKDVDHKILDTTYSGVEEKAFSTTLGLRPQAMKLKVLEGDGVRGKFLKRTIPISKIFDRAAHLTDYFNEKAQSKILFHRAFIGETISLIYFPTYLKNDELYDGVLNRLISKDFSTRDFAKNSVGYQKKWSPDFLAMLCPHCGDTLEGEKDSLVLHCHNCYKAWFEEKGKFGSIAWQAGFNEKNSIPQLPFWKLKVKCLDVGIQSFGDYLRVTNQPVLITKEHDELSFSVFIPAFKLQPKMFLTLAKRFTGAQTRLPVGSRENYGRLYPVTLALNEAVESLKSILVNSAVHKKEIAPKIEKAQINTIGYELVYLPFEQKGNDLTQKNCNITLASSTLHLGRKL